MNSGLFLALLSAKGEVTIYALERIENGWALKKQSGDKETYHVERRKGQVSCDCHDFLNRREPHGTVCKHCSAIIEKGLLP